MNKTFPLILNSILFIAGICSIAFDQPLVCAVCLLSISLLCIWKPISSAAQATDDAPETEKCTEDRVEDFQQLEQSLRIQELTESNQLLNEEVNRLRQEQQACTHPLYSCPLTAALPVNLEEFFTGYIKNRFDMARGSRVHPNFHCATPKAETCLSAAALQIICDNVIDNMLKFSPATANLYETIYIRIADLDGDTLIIFKNEGEGIPDHETSLIFDLNYQGANKKGGTGLGLAQVSALVSDYGGRTWAKSSRNTGFTLYIQLPQRHKHKFQEEL